LKILLQSELLRIGRKILNARYFAASRCFSRRKVDREKLARELRVTLILSRDVSRRGKSATIKCKRTRTNASGTSARLVDIHATTFIDSCCRWFADDRMVLTLSLPLRRPPQTPVRRADDNDVIISITKITKNLKSRTNIVFPRETIPKTSFENSVY